MSKHDNHSELLRKLQNILPLCELWQYKNWSVEELSIECDVLQKMYDDVQKRNEATEIEDQIACIFGKFVTGLADEIYKNQLTPYDAFCRVVRKNGLCNIELNKEDVANVYEQCNGIFPNKNKNKNIADRVTEHLKKINLHDKEDTIALHEYISNTFHKANLQLGSFSTVSKQCSLTYFVTVFCAKLSQRETCKF
jgi:hypothetical protein